MRSALNQVGKIFSNPYSPMFKQYADQSTQTESDDNEPLFFGGSDSKKLQTTRPDFQFQFQGNDNHLSCSIFVTEPYDLPKGLVKSIVDYLVVRDLNEEQYNVAVDYEQTIVKRLTIKFNMKVAESIEHKKMLKCVIEFVEHLKTLQLQEVNENTDALWFYAANGGEEILNFTNYPTGINEFLEEERFQTNAILNDAGNRYTILVEVGCGSMENVALAINNNLKYLGVDFTAPRIIEAKERIRQQKMEGVSVQHLDIVNFNESELAHLSTERAVFMFPFNLLGNIAPIVKFMARFNHFGHDMLLSIYKTDEETNAIRLSYYKNCGYTNIRMIKNDQGVVFSSKEGLYTIAYDQDYLVNLLNAVGFTVNVFSSNRLGVVLHAMSSVAPNLKPRPPIFIPPLKINSTHRILYN